MPIRLRAARLYLATLSALFLLVTVVCALTGAWLAECCYALVSAGSVLFIFRFLGPLTRQRTAEAGGVRRGQRQPWPYPQAPIAQGSLIRPSTDLLGAAAEPSGQRVHRG